RDHCLKNGSDRPKSYWTEIDFGRRPDRNGPVRYSIINAIDSFINYLKRANHSKISELLKAKPKQVPLDWKTTKNGVDCGVFVMRHMESYIGRGNFVYKFKKEGSGQKPEIKILRAKYLIKILLIDFNLKMEDLIKEAEKNGEEEREEL
ncbi:ulp1 protease family, C-terminal catalytic domain-containing protein, partial [Tanacetum coccineum]